MNTKSNILIPFFLEPSWLEILEKEPSLPYMAELMTFLDQERLGNIPVYPPEEFVFKALNMTPYKTVNVVIVGQDPYHGPGQADGLCFSVPQGISIPPSLRNIFKELQSDLGIQYPKHGNLEAWAKQGILLLNATLTVKQGDPTSHHGRGWETFTDAIIKALIGREEPVIFVLWGKHAFTKFQHIHAHNKGQHRTLIAAHPSPFSANRGFFGCRHFSKINDFLADQGKKIIDWNLD